MLLELKYLTRGGFSYESWVHVRGILLPLNFCFRFLLPADCSSLSQRLFSTFACHVI